MKKGNEYFKKVLTYIILTFAGLSCISIYTYKRDHKLFIPDGKYSIKKSYSSGYWGFDIDIEFKNNVGYVLINDVRNQKIYKDTIILKDLKYEGKRITIQKSIKEEWLFIFKDPGNGNAHIFIIKNLESMRYED
ncbi:MAG: hypothetical protein ABUK01_19415 [Leptospirales bacterium]